jgi:hypothetical protein
VVHNTIIAFNDATPINSYLEIACTDIFGNTQGDWRGDLAAYLDMDGNISQDPLFCDTAAYDYSLNGFSPCLAAGNSCQETIGAYDLGCGVVCGEIDGDIGINIADVVYLVNYIFRDGPPPVNMPAADTNASGEVDVGDAVALLNYIFRSEDIITCTFND